MIIIIIIMIIFKKEGQFSYASPIFPKDPGRSGCVLT